MTALGLALAAVLAQDPPPNPFDVRLNASDCMSGWQVDQGFGG